jgi:hypothetical protein
MAIRIGRVVSFHGEDLSNSNKNGQHVSEANTFMRRQLPKLIKYQLTTNNLRHDRVPFKNGIIISFYRNNNLHVAIKIINRDLFSSQNIIRVMK